MSTINILTCQPASYEAYIPSLAKLHVSCIEAGAEISFVTPVPHDDLYAYWNRMLPSVMSGTNIVFVAIEEETKELVGCVILTPAWQPNAPHRADVSKLLVDPSARGRGISSRLMKHLEEHAKGIGRTLLVLDTRKGSDADSIYRKWGWTEVGSIPDYAYDFDGSALLANQIFYKQI